MPFPADDSSTRTYTGQAPGTDKQTDRRTDCSSELCPQLTKTTIEKRNVSTCERRRSNDASVFLKKSIFTKYTGKSWTL